MSAIVEPRIFAALLCVSLTVGLGGTATAQDAKPKRPPPTAGALPVEDPTNRPPPLEEAPEEAPEHSPGDAPKNDDEGFDEVETAETDTEPDENPTPAEGLRARPDEVTEERTTGATPVEDPTLDITTEPDEEAPTGEIPGEEAPIPETPTDEGKKDDRADVRVAYDNGFLVSVDNWFYLALSGVVQGRYSVNYRTDPPIDPETMVLDLNVTQGFDVPRARFTLGIGLTEFVALVMRIGVVSGGDFEFQRAFIDLKWKFFRLRAGLFMNELIAESLVNPWDLMFADYSIVENVFSPGSSKGIMMTYLRQRFSINLGYSDGLRTGFSEIRAASNADFAVTARTQFAWGKLGLVGFNRFNARRGTPLGIRLGAAIHYQNGGRTQGSLPAKVALGTIDLVARGSGWTVFFSAVVGQDTTEETETATANELVSSGVTIMGGYFVLENLQVFGQYGIVPKPRIQGTLPPDVTDPNSFQSVGFGASYFVIPKFDNVKVTTDFQYFIGSELGSLVPASPLNGIQPNDAGSQFLWRIQLSAAF